MNDISISKDKSSLDVDWIHQFLTTSYWAEGRTKTEVENSIRHSHCYGVYKGDEQIGFARVISDTVVFAYIMDVFILEQERGKGHALDLMTYILNDVSLQNVKQWYLKTKDSHGFYAKIGFHQLKNAAWFMEILKM